MVELKRCSGYMGHWECSDEYPDHMVPVGDFYVSPSRHDGYQPICKSCTLYCHNQRTKHPVTGQLKTHWKTAKAVELGGDIKNRHAPEWKFHMDWAEVMWGEEITTPAIPKFKSKKPKFNQGQYKSSPSKPKDSTKEVVPKEGPGFVYVFIDEMKMPGWRKIGATRIIDERLQDGNTWGAFTCLYRKEFKRRFEAETKIFELLDDYRVYSDKEWFKVNTALAIKTIEGMYELP